MIIFTIILQKILYYYNENLMKDKLHKTQK